MSRRRELIVAERRAAAPESKILSRKAIAHPRNSRAIQAEDTQEERSVAYNEKGAAPYEQWIEAGLGRGPAERISDRSAGTDPL